jgi:hypothetical protein
MVEIKIKRIDENGTYYEIVPVGELNDKFSYCETFQDKTDEEVLAIGEVIINNLINNG